MAEFVVAFDELNECWEVTVDTPPVPRWTLSFDSEKGELWTEADAVIEARKTLIGYSLRRDQPGLLPEVRAQFRALPTPTEIACGAFTLEGRETDG
jgi:hypothetical protein